MYVTLQGLPPCYTHPPYHRILACAVCHTSCCHASQRRCYYSFSYQPILKVTMPNFHHLQMQNVDALLNLGREYALRTNYWSNG